MAWENELLVIGQTKSSGDMSSHQYKAVSLSTSNGADGVIVAAVRGGRVDGVWQGNSTVATGGGLMVHGVSKLVAGDSSGGTSITFGMKLVASSQGHAVASTAAGQNVIGISYGTIASTGILPVFLTIGALSS